MGLSEWVLIVVVLLVLAGWWLWVQAMRVDRLHRKVLASRSTLEAQLVQRAAAASSLATSGALDPASAVVLVDVAHRALALAPDHVVVDGLEGPLVAAVTGAEQPDSAGNGPGRSLTDREGPDRGLAESELSRALRAVLGGPVERAQLAQDPRAEEPLRELEHAWYRAELARRFHNAHVAAVRRQRGHTMVRTLHLAGRAPMPEPVELDDVRPPAD